MNKIIFTLAFVLLPTMIFSQSAFDKFDGPEEVTAVTVTKKMFQMMGKVDSKDKDAQQFLALVKKLDNLKVFTTNNTRWATDMKATTDKYLKTAGLEELMRINDKGQSIKIMVKSGNSDTHIRELLMFIEGSGKGNETVLMTLTGDFDLNEISVLTDKMNFPGGNDLKNATKGAKGPKGPKGAK